MISYIHLYEKLVIIIPSSRKTDNHQWYNALYSNCFFLTEEQISLLPHLLNLDLVYEKPKLFKLFL